MLNILSSPREAEVAAQREQRVRDMARRTHPKSNADFAVLYNELDSWRKVEVGKIKASVSDPEERKLAMAELLQNETKALQGLQKLKLSAQRELQVEKTQQMLERMSMPHVWQLSRGEAAQVHFCALPHNGIFTRFFVVVETAVTALSSYFLTHPPRSPYPPQVFTPETQRAKELLDLFNALNAPLMGTDQRLDVLLNVKVRAVAFYVFPPFIVRVTFISQ